MARRAAAARGGVFPIVVSQWAAIGLTVYMVATHAVLYYVRSPKHLEALWFSNVANTLMWFTYVKALHSALSAAVLGKAITFKTTMKGAAMLMNTAFRDMVRPRPPARVRARAGPGGGAAPDARRAGPCSGCPACASSCCWPRCCWASSSWAARRRSRRRSASPSSGSSTRSSRRRS